MKAVVFAGPSVPRASVEDLPGVQWRPPVSQGDVYRAAQSSPVAIAIVDGYFEGVPSVWHKEILWAMSRGIHVFGAASMGALRAAELYQFGMRGVGEIFESYRDGIIEDDDEVAVLHGPEELDYQPLSLPMVNARATIGAALDESVITKNIAEKLTEVAKSVFYQNRRWDGVVSGAKRAGIDAVQLADFEGWLANGERDLKRQDAATLLAELGAFLTLDTEPMHCGYAFEWTVMWDGIVASRSGERGGARDAAVDCAEQFVIDELRLDPQKYRQINLCAGLKQLALREAGRKRIETDNDQMRKLLQRLREANGLYSRAQLDEWIEEVDWNSRTLQKALEDEQRRNTVVERLGVIDERILLDELRLCGDYAAFKARAEAKRAVDMPAAAGRAVPPAQLLIWYFESQLGEPVPSDLDAYLVEIGIHQRQHFYRLLERQYLFRLAMTD